MGQVSTPILNKVGYSMFWSSMWDNKINYNRSFKEDIYLKRFINLIFEDCASANTIKFYNKQYSKIIFNTYRIPTKAKKPKELYKYLTKNNKIVFYSSKLWILKYQKWIILYIYLYLPIYNKLKTRIFIQNHNTLYKDSILNLYNFYKKSNLKMQTSYNILKNQKIKYYF